MKKFLYLFSFLFLIASCGSDDDFTDDKPGQDDPFERTVLFYISGENNLSSYIAQELREMRIGSKGIGNNAMVVYVDDSNPYRNPYILRIRDGITVDSLPFSDDPLSSSAETMTRVLNYTSTHYPADEYGLVLWGHASGWLLEDSVATTPAGSRQNRGFGIDNGKNNLSIIGKWMNMHTLAKTLWEWKKLKFIFADCCQFQCIESAYELRNVTDYIIGSPAEIPGQGAPYNTVVKGMFEHSETFYKTIVDSYFAQVIPIYNYKSYQYNSRTPLSVIKTSELQNLAYATNEVLHHIQAQEAVNMPNLANEKLIYYCGNTSKPSEDVMYDMNDFIHHYTIVNDQTGGNGQAVYDTWKEAFDRTVIYRKNADKGWMTNDQIRTYVFTSGILTDERYGGASMFVPQDRKNTWYYPYTYNGVKHNGYNEDIKTTAWYYAARLSDFGW